MIHDLNLTQHDLMEQQPPEGSPHCYARGSLSPTVVLQRDGQQNITFLHKEEMNVFEK